MIDPLATPARVAYCGDWHMNAAWASRAIGYAAAHGADVAIHLGDYGYTFDTGFMAAVDEALDAAGIGLLFVDGNHEDFTTLLAYPLGADGLRQLTDRVWHLPRGFRWQWAGRTYLALGGAHSVDRPWRRPGISWWREETISTQDAVRAARGGPADVLVSHDCPHGVPIPGLGPPDAEPARGVAGPSALTDSDAEPGAGGTAMFWPREEIAHAKAHRRVLRAVVDEVRPDEIWHGHYHRRYTATADLGYGPVRVTGLDRDETALELNVLVVDV